MRWAGLIVVAFVVGCFPVRPAVMLTAEPKAVLPQAQFDFGEVRLGDPVHHRFVIQNGGRLPLTVETARSECACTTTVQPGGTIAAGDAGWVDMSFDTTGAAGDRLRTVTLETNDPTQPEIVVSLRGTVRPDVSLSPDHVFFGRVPRGVSRTRIVEVDTEPEVSILRVRKDSTRFELRVENREPPETGLRIHVTLRPQRRSGPFDDVLEVTTSSERQATIAVPVLGYVH